MKVFDKLRAKFQLATFHLGWDIEIGSKVGQASRELCAFRVDHFYPRYPIYPEHCSIWMKLDTHIVEVIDSLHANFQLPTLSLIRDYKIGSGVGRASGENWSVFRLITFFLASPFTQKIIWFRCNTNLMEGAVNHFLLRLRIWFWPNAM